MRTIKIVKNPYDFGRPMFPTAKVDFNPGITVLVGCNGSGKTTMLQNIESELKKANISYMKYSDVSEGRDHANNRYDFYGNMDAIITNFVSSEGERIHNNFGNMFVSKVRRFARKHQSEKELWFLLDALDSGTSIDMIRDTKDLFQLMLKDFNGNEIHIDDVYIVIAANSFEMARDQDCLLMRTFGHTTFHDYDDFADEIMKSKKKKEKRFETTIKENV